MRSMKASRAVRGARCARGAMGRGRRASSSSAAAAAAVAASATTKERKASPLEAGGTLEGKQALGKDAAASTIKKSDSASASGSSSSSSSYWSDDRWVKGRWDYNQFKNEQGETDWDAVLDAEVVRRKALEENPSPSMLDSHRSPALAHVALIHLAWPAWAGLFGLVYLAGSFSWPF